MPIQTVTNDTKFTTWKDITNNIKDLSELNQTNIVNTDTIIGNTSLSTSATTLTTAINELYADININSGNITTTNTNLGSLGSLSTPAIDFVTAINYNDNRIGDLTSLPDNPVNVALELAKIGQITNLTTIDKSDTVSAINELQSSLSVLTPSNLNHNNLEVNHGRFMVETILSPASPTLDTGIFNTFNSSTIIADDKFIDDNPTNGTVGTNMTTLLSKLSTNGRTQTAFGYEFYIIKLQSGGGTSNQITVNATNYYPQSVNNNIYLGKIGHKVTWQGYIKNDDVVNNVIIGDITNTNIKTYIDNVLQVASYELSNATGWVHVRQILTLADKEYENIFPSIYSVGAGTDILISLSALFEGDVNIEHLGLL